MNTHTTTRHMCSNDADDRERNLDSARLRVSTRGHSRLVARAAQAFGVFALLALGASTAQSQSIPNIASRPFLKESVWGIAPDNSVWKWTGNYWYEPNPAAALRQISVGYGEVWGVTSNDHVWKWNGNSWFEPNPAAVLSEVSVGRGADFGSAEVWGIGVNSTVWRWNGNSWYEPNPGTIRYKISVGSSDNIWSIGAGNRIYKWSGSNWIEPEAAARGWQIDANFFGQGAWKIGTIGIYDAYPVYKWNGSTWWQPNPNALARHISARTDRHAWAIGYDHRVFQTTTGGANWTEPNPAAGLLRVSVGYEWAGGISWHL